MSRADITPDKVKILASQLVLDGRALGEVAAHMQHQMGRLGDAWQDEGVHRFSADLQKLTRSIANFREEIEAHASYLIDKANAAEDYLRF